MIRMPHIKVKVFRPLMLVLCCGMSFFSVFNMSAFAADESIRSSRQPPNQAQASKSEKSITMDFRDVDINVVIETIGALIGKNFIIDNNVRGKVTIISPIKISVDEAYKVFESMLEVHGLAAVPSGQVTKIVPSTEARSKNIETRLTSDDILKRKDTEDKLVTQLIPLTFADANQIRALFTPLVSKTSVILAYADTNTLIVTDVSSNIKRLLHILSAIDVPGIGREVTVIPLEFADATKMVKILSSFFPLSAAKGKGVTQKARQFVADERTNTVVFLASEDDTSRIKQLISLLDRDTPKGKGNIRVYYLEHATAEDMAQVLQDLPKGKSGTQPGKEGAILSDQINITADKATNSLVIMADSDDYLVIEEIIKKLDIPRSMVYIESMIMEVNVDKASELGIEWSAFGDADVNGNKGVVGGSFSTSAGLNPTDVLTPNGIAIGGVSIGEGVQIGGIPVPNIGILIKAFESDEDVQILSTPRVTTLDNEEATIIVGRDVPFKTKTSTSSASDDIFSSIEYRTVGLTLKITPHISHKDRMVRLKISQELTSLTGASSEISSTPTTLNRSVETTVIVKDKEMLVIGGLIDDNMTNTVKQVPILGSIPILGRLFRSSSKINNKTNLYIFITPRIVKNPIEAEELMSDTKEKMTPMETGLIKMYGPTPRDENAEPDSTNGSAQ